MKILKYGTVFKNVSGGKAHVAHEGISGYSIITELGHQKLGLGYRGEHNRMFIRAMKEDKNWTVGEMEAVDFTEAMNQAFAAPPEGSVVKRIDVERLADAIDYAGKPVDPKHANTMLSAIWCHDGAIYGTDGHRMHRVKDVLPPHPMSYGFNPTMLNAFMALVEHDKKSAWAGVVYLDGAVRLFGGNDFVDCWLDTTFMPEETSYTKLLDFFAAAEADLGKKIPEGVFLMDKAGGELRMAVRNAPVTEDGNVGLYILPDVAQFTDKAVLPDPIVPPLKGVSIISGQWHIDTAYPIRVCINHKYLMQALDVPGRVALFTQGGEDFLWISNGRYAAMVMPLRFWQDMDDKSRLTVKQRWEREQDDAVFDGTGP